MELSDNKFSLFLLLAFLISGLFFFRVSDIKAVGNAYFPQDTTVELSSVNFTIEGGSDADSVTTSGGSIDVTISSGQSFVFKSTDKYYLKNDGGVDIKCNANDSRLDIAVTTAKTIKITPELPDCSSSSRGGGGGGGGGGSVIVSGPTSTPIPAVPISTIALTPASRGFVSLVALNLREGDVVSAAGSDDPDVYIVNDWGYKRLFLNPAIFGFYGHLGGFAKVKNTVVSTRDTLVTSGLFRNCETNDEKVYGVETTGEDTGMLHWVNTTGAQAIADDSDFFKKVFCINNNEFNWYQKGMPYTSVNQIPSYVRTGI